MLSSIALLFVLAILFIVGYSMLLNKIRGLPPGPPPLPVLGNFLQCEMNMHKACGSLWSAEISTSFQKLMEWKKKYGRVFTIWLPHPIVVICDHELMQQHIVKDGEKFSDRLNRKMRMDLTGGEYGLIFNGNSMWREQRRFALHSLRNIGFTSSAIQDAAIINAQENIALWKKQGANRQPVDVTMGIMNGVSKIIWLLTFDRNLSIDDPLIERVKTLATDFLIAVTHPAILAMEFVPSIRHLEKFTGEPMKQFNNVLKDFIGVIENELEIVRNNLSDEGEPTCFAEAFLREMRRREEKGEDLGTFTHIQSVASCFDLFIAGFETTVTTLRFAIHHMLNHPEVQRKAQQEIDEKIGKRTIQMEDQKHLHYCNAEVLRLANIFTINFTRKVSAPVNIDGYDIPAGTGIVPEFSIVHMDEMEFERPEYFCPDRHIDESGNFVKDPRITPFSLGKRACLGEGLARMELFIYFTHFIQHLHFSPVSKVPPAPIVHYSFNRSPAPFKVLIESRD